MLSSSQRKHYKKWGLEWFLVLHHEFLFKRQESDFNNGAIEEWAKRVNPDKNNPFRPQPPE